MLRVSKSTPRNFFVAIFLLYLSGSPGVFRSVGYMEEETAAARYVVDRVLGNEAGQFEWPRNGGFPVLVHVPFILASQLFFGRSVTWEDRFLAIEPVLLMSLIITLLFIWIRRRTDPLWALLLTLTAAFCTMLWPYAYIGMESGQALALLLASFFAIERRGVRTWMEVATFAVVCGLTVSLKSTGLFLAPAVLFLIFTYFELDAKPRRLGLPVILRMIFTLSVVASMAGVAAYTRSFFWAKFGGTKAYILFWLVRDPLEFALNAIASLSSPNKGLFIYAPLTLLCFFSLFRLARRGSRTAMVTILSLVGIIGGFSMLRAWTDENWGPRYLLSCIPLLVVCVAEKKRGTVFRPIRELALVAAAVTGLAISLPGALFAYGSLHKAATDTAQNTLQVLHGDPSWNHIRFNTVLLKAFLTGQTAAIPWPPPAHRSWSFRVPAGPAEPSKTVNLNDILDLNGRAMSVPQTFAIRMRWSEEQAAQTLIRILVAAFVWGALTLTLISIRIVYAAVSGISPYFEARSMTETIESRGAD